MMKLRILASAFFLVGLVSCASDSEKGNLKTDSQVTDSVKADTNRIDSVSTANKTAPADVDALLPQLALLKFPLILDVDSFEKRTGIEVFLNQNLPWFADFLEFHAGTKVRAMGKFYVDASTQAVVYLTSAPNDYPERPNDVELIVSLYNKLTGSVDSRILAISDGEAYGNSIMKNPGKGKSFVNQQMDEINVTFQNFSIKDGAFVLGVSEDKKYAGDQKGSDESKAAIEAFMK